MVKKNVLYLIVALILTIGIVCYIIFSGNNNYNTFVSLKIISNGETISGQYKVGDEFKCNVLGEEFEIKIDSISDEKVELSSSKYGLCPINEDGTINLKTKVRRFKLFKGKELDLGFQAMDVSRRIVIIWE